MSRVALRSIPYLTNPLFPSFLSRSPLGSSVLLFGPLGLVPPQLDPVLLVPSARGEVHGVYAAERHDAEQDERFGLTNTANGLTVSGKDAAALQHLALADGVRRGSLSFSPLLKVPRFTPGLSFLTSSNWMFSASMS